MFKNFERNSRIKLRIAGYTSLGGYQYPERAKRIAEEFAKSEGESKTAILFIVKLYRMPGKAIGAPMQRILENYEDCGEWLLPDGIQLMVANVSYNKETQIHEILLTNNPDVLSESEREE